MGRHGDDPGNAATPGRPATTCSPRPREPDPRSDPRPEAPSCLSDADDHFGFASHAGLADGRGTLAAGSRCGDCTVVRLLAEGGMGRVYEARQDAPARLVAVKVMRESFSSPDLARRFTREADLLARLRHPAIAQVHAAGFDAAAGGGLPFIVMELVEEATTITAFSRERGLGPRDRVALFARACRGVAHAHEQGIIHRDLKPANLLVDVHGEPKVIDFGVGRSLAGDSERLTIASQRGDLLGTVRYMSPEQLGVGDAAVDARSDVFALGLVLHELLTGELPWDLRGRPVAEAACLLAASRGVAAGTLVRGFIASGMTVGEARPLAAVLSTCLEPAASDRYADAGEVAADLARWLAGEPVRARPPTVAESLARLARRHRAAAAVAVVGAAALAAAAAGVAVFWIRAERDRAAARRAEAVAEDRRRQADAGAAEARDQLFLSTVLLAAEARDRDNLGEARRLLAEAEHLAAQRDDAPVELACLAASLDESLHVLADNGDTVTAVASSPDGRTVAVGTMAGRLRTWLPDEPAAEPGEPPGHEAAVWDVAISRDGRLLGSASADGTVRIVPLADGGGEATLTGHGAAVYAVDFSPDGSLLATASRDRTVRLWETGTWRERSVLRGHQGTVYSVRFSPDGDRLVSAGQDGTARIWSVAESREVLTVAAGRGRVFRAAFSPDGGRIATACEDGSASLWDTSGGGRLARLDHAMRVNAVAFLADGERLVTGCGDGLLRCWDVGSGAEVSRRRGHDGAIWAVALASATAVTGSADGTVRCWRLDGSGDPLLPLADRGQAVAVDADGRRLAAGDATGRVLLVDPRTLLQPHAFETGGGRVTAAAFAPDGDTLAVACEDGRVHRWHARDGRPLPPLEVHGRLAYCVAFSPDGRSLATGSDDRTARVVDAMTGGQRLQPLRHPARVFGVAFHPDGLRLATACGDRIVRIWSLETGRELHAWPGHEGQVNWVSFTAAGDRLASASSDGSVRIWHVASGDTTVLTGPARQVWQVAFSPDGGRVAATVADGTVHIWAAAGGRTVAVLRGHRDQAWGLAFLPGGRALATTSWDATVRLWGVSAASLARARTGAD